MTVLEAIEAISRLGCFVGAMGYLFCFFKDWDKLDDLKKRKEVVNEPEKSVPRSREKAEKGKNANDCTKDPCEWLPILFKFFYHGLLFLVFFTIFKL